jgi:hypothetical protein
MFCKLCVLVFLLFFVLICLDLKWSFHLSWLVHILLNFSCQLGWFCACDTNIMVSLSLSITTSFYHIIFTFFNYFCFLSIPSTMTKTFCLLWSMELAGPRLIIRGHLTTPQRNCSFLKMELKVVLMFIWMTLIFQNALILVGINIKLPMDVFFDEQQIVNIHFEG